MSQTVAFVLPLPVALALVFLLLVLLALSAVALSMRRPAPLRMPDAGERDGEGSAAQAEDAAGFRLGRLQIDGLAELSGPERHVR